jgi:hypothetical protein
MDAFNVATWHLPVFGWYKLSIAIAVPSVLEAGGGGEFADDSLVDVIKEFTVHNTTLVMQVAAGLVILPAL